MVNWSSRSVAPQPASPLVAHEEQHQKVIGFETVAERRHGRTQQEQPVIWRALDEGAVNSHLADQPHIRASRTLSHRQTYKRSKVVRSKVVRRRSC